MAQTVTMPNGDRVSFPDDMPREEIRALIEEKFPDAAAKAAQSGKPSMMDQVKAKAGEITAETKKPFNDSYISQGLSGINEGIGNALSLPATLANAALSVGPALTNAVTGSDFKGPNYIPDPGVPARELMKMSGAIQPETDDVGKQVVRRIGQEVGAALPFGMTRPIATAASAIGSGLGGAVAEQVAPGNPYAEFAGQVIGGAGVAGAAGAVRKSGGKPVTSKAMSGDELELAKRDAYKVVDDLGVKYTPQGLGQMANDIAAATAKASPIRHPKAVSMVQDIKEWVKNGMSLTELDQLRQQVRLEVIRSGDEAEGAWGEAILDEIDNFIAKAGPGQVTAGIGADGNKAILTARELNTRWRKTELIEDALYKANMRNEAADSGNITAKIKQAFNSILLDKKKRASYSADEIADMENVVKTGNGEKVLRLIGGLSPNGNGLKSLLAIFGTAVNPWLAAIPVTGMAAKAIAGGRTIKKAATLRAKVAQGGGNNTLKVPAFSADDAVPATALVLGNAANQNEKRNTLRMNALN